MDLVRNSLMKSRVLISRYYFISIRYSSTLPEDSNTSKTCEGTLRKNVIDLYKNLIYLSREWPTDLRPQIKNAFMKNRDVKDVEEIKKLIERGEYVSREITATYHLRKYRALKRRYYSDSDREKELEKIFSHYSK